MKTYGSVEWRDGLWVITDLLPHAAIKLKHLFQGVRKVQQPPIELPKREETPMDLEWFMVRYPLKMSGQDSELLSRQVNDHKARLDRAERIFQSDYTPAPVKLNGELRHYQAVAVDLFDTVGRLLVGDWVGLGKTITAIGCMTRARLPAMVVIQPHLLKQWQSQVERFLGLRCHIIKTRKPYELPVADVYLMAYSRISGWTDIGKTGAFPFIIFDECQELRKEDSDKYQASKIFADAAERVLGLSATPVYNFGNEIFNVMNVIKPGALGGWGDFSREWCGYGSRVNDPKALGSYLRDKHLFIRRSRQDVSLELPLRDKIVHEIGSDAKAIESVEQLAHSLAMRTMTGSFMERGQAARELDLLMRQATGIGKAAYVAEYVRIFLESGEPVLLLGWHRACYDIWLEKLREFNPVMYTGSESPAQKEEARQKFLSGESNLMIMSLRSGVGLDGLQERCSTVIFGELDWSSKVHEQCLSMDTEILTSNGFVRCDGVCVGDQVYAFDISCGAIRAVPVKKKVFRKAESGEAFCEAKSESISICVTDNHRMIVRRARRTKFGNIRSGWEIVRAKKVVSAARRYLPVAGIEERSGVDLTPDQLKLIGWYISGGYFDGRTLYFYQAAHQPWCGDGKSGTLMNWYMVPKGVGVSWSRDEISTLESMIGISSCKEIGAKIGRTDVAVYKMWLKLKKGRVNKELLGTNNMKNGWLHLESFLDKDISPRLDDISSAQLSYLIDGIFMGDGSKTGRRVKKITSTNKRMLDRLQSLCIRSGLSAIIRTRKSKTKAGKMVFDIHISDSTEAMISFSGSPGMIARKPDPVEMVWCVENELGTIITRRDGKVSIVGNCIGRVERDGQKNKVTVIYLVSDEGSDPPMIELLALKSAQADGITDPFSAQQEIQSADDSRIKMLAQAVLSRRKRLG